MKEVEEDVTTLLADLIRINTSNPPGNETVAASFLAKYLEKEGFKCELIESAPGRGNVITRIKGKSLGNERKPSLLLLSHLDVVPALAKEWSVEPFGGVVKDGFVWGRGALDMKSLVAIEAILMCLLKKNRVNLKGDIIFAATADEERGGRAGVKWLVEHFPDKIRADYVINEGGGFSIPVDGDRHIFTVQTAEKGVVWIKVKAKGSPGHGSIPGIADNAVLRMGEVITKLGNYRSKILVTTTVKKCLQGFASERGSVWRILPSLIMNPLLADRALDRMAKNNRAIAEYIRAMLRTTITPTMVNGGIKENVIPSQCEGVLDCRILPGQTPDKLMEEIKNVVADIDSDSLSFEFIQADTPSESPIDTPFFSSIEKTLKEFEPNCNIVPLMTTGGTDSRFLREIGCVCYGFGPLKVDMPFDQFMKLAHGIDERISINNLIFGVSVLYRLIENFMT
jgi:acetylornithine deacetylase/succinyl-diaminopimelate desuccinylase-like protein